MNLLFHLFLHILCFLDFSSTWNMHISSSLYEIKWKRGKLLTQTEEDKLIIFWFLFCTLSDTCIFLDTVNFQIARELEAVNTVKQPLKSSLLNGKWELLYTTSTAILKTEVCNIYFTLGIYFAIKITRLFYSIVFWMIKELFEAEHNGNVFN